MKIGSRQFSKLNEEIIPICRADGDIIFKAGIVIDFDEFDKLCPEPQPRMKLVRGHKTPVPATDEVEYIKAMSDYAEKRSNWLILKSLESTPDLNWDTIKMDDPTTWGGYIDELKAFGLNIYEINRIVRGVMSANSLDDKRIEEARDRFLAQEAEQSRQSSQPDVAVNI